MRFAAFFDGIYLPAHKKPLTREIHFIGTGLALGSILLALWTLNPWWLLGAPLCGYGLAWPSHWLVEHNQPETFQQPFMSLAGDLFMLALAVSGQLYERIAESRSRFPAVWQ